MHIHRAALRAGFVAAVAFASPAALASDPNLPPFDFSDEYYIANGIDPTTLIGRPTGTGPNSVIDDRENGPNFNNIRILAHAAAYDHSGHPIFFYVTGLPTLASFMTEEALEIAESYDVYEFPRAANAPFGIFPKRQDLIADLRNGYFSNNPLGVWRVKIVHYTAAAFDTEEGRETLAELAEDNGYDLDGTPLIRTISEVEDLLDDGLVTIEIPAMDGSQGLRWFFCPIIEDREDGGIAPDAHLDAVEIPAAEEFIELFHCLQTTGEEDCDAPGHSSGDCNDDGQVNFLDLNILLGFFGTSNPVADFDGSGTVDFADLNILVSAFGA